MVTLFNMIWFIFFGFWTSVLTFFLGVLMCITIVGIPIGKSLFQLSKLNGFPYGKVIIRETQLKGRKRVSIIRQLGGLLLNILWFPIGFILTMMYFLMAIVAALTIVGLPVAILYFKIGQFVLFPIGAKVITKKAAYASAAEALRRRV